MGAILHYRQAIELVRLRLQIVLTGTCSHRYPFTSPDSQGEIDRDT